MTSLCPSDSLKLWQGGSLNRAHEHIVQAMYLNIQHDLRAMAPTALLFQSASLDRLGESMRAKYNLKWSANIMAYKVNRTWQVEAMTSQLQFTHVTAL